MTALQEGGSSPAEKAVSGHWRLSPRGIDMRRAKLVAALMLAGIAGCERATAPNVSLVLARTPDALGVVTSSSYATGQTPGGPERYYDFWFASPPETAPSAGVAVVVSTPVFLSRQGVLGRASAGSIAAGDTIQVWTDGSSAYGTADSPPGTPCYLATQIVIRR